MAADETATSWWHGTSTKYAQQIRAAGRLVNFRSQNALAVTYGPGVYLTTDPAMAVSFREGAEAVPLSFHASNPFITENGNAFAGVKDVYPDLPYGVPVSEFLATKGHDAFLFPGGCVGERWALIFNPAAITWPPA